MKFALRKFGTTEKWFAWKPKLVWENNQRVVVWLIWLNRVWYQPNYYNPFNHWEYDFIEEDSDGQ